MIRPVNHLHTHAVILACALLALASIAQAEYLGNISFDRATPSFLPLNEEVTVSIDYKIDDPAGRRIYVLPYTDGAPSPNYAVSGSPVYPQGTGTVTKYFRITSGEVAVDEVRVYMRDPDFTETPLEIFVPAIYRYGDHAVFNIQPSTTPHGQLRHGNSLSVSFDYSVDAASCRIYGRPWSGSHTPSGYTASGSALLPSSGSYSQWFSFDDDAEISHIVFRVYTGDGQTLLDEFFYPFICRWRQIGLYDIEFNHGNLTSLHNSQNLVTSFTIDHEESVPVRVWTQAYQDGSYCPGTVYQPSPAEPTGPHSTTRYTRVNSGTEEVDAIHFVIGDGSNVYDSFDVPLLVQYGPHAIQNVAFTPASPAVLTPGEHLDMTFDYLTDEAAGVRIFGRAAYQEELLFGMTSAGSPLYPAPTGSGDFWMTYNNSTTANSIRFAMVSGDQSQTFLEWFEPGWFIWSDSGTVTDAELPDVITALGRAYPNPFNPVATIPVTLSRDDRVRLSVYDLKGRLVTTLHDGSLAAGTHEFRFDGAALGSGVYLCRLQTADGAFTQRMTLVK